MKRKRGCGRRKPKMAPLGGANKEFLNGSLNTQDDCVPDDFYNSESDSRTENETPQKADNESRQKAADVSKKARNTRSLRGLDSRVKTNSNIELAHGGGTPQKDPAVSHQDPPYKEQELKKALAVIRKVMKMDAAEPFNVPVDPIALGIPDYFDVIDTPMDFGTICNNLENGPKYKNSRDVLRDVQYIWDNCSKCNNGQYILELMKRVKKNFTQFWTEAGLHLKQPHEINGPEDDNSTHMWQRETVLSQPKLHQYQPSSSYCQPSYPQMGSCHCQPISVHPQSSHLQAGSCIASAESMVRRSPCGHKYQVGFMDEDPSHTWATDQNQTGMTQSQLHQHPSSLCCSQHRPCPCQPSFGHRRPSKPHTGTDHSVSGHLCSQPPAGSMIGCSKLRPSCSVGPMADYASHEQQVQIGSSQMMPHHPSATYGHPNPLQQGTCQDHLNSSHPQSSKPQTGMEMGNAVILSLPPPVGSMIVCSKRGPPRYPMGPMTDYPSYEQPDQIAPSQMLHRDSSGNNTGPHQPQPSQPQTGTNVGTSDSSSIRRRTRGRGPTRCLDVWNSEGKISIATNELGQPIGSEAPKLTNFLGTIARNGHMAPLNYVDWRALPDANKVNMWQQVQLKFDINPISINWVLKSIGKKWKDWKAELKATRYNTHATDEERLADCDERVFPDQWRILISFWNSKEAKERSCANKAIRSLQKTSHTTGRKSFARVREELRAKRPDGKEPSRAELFILTRTRKDGLPINEASSAIISELRKRAAPQNGTVGDDIFFKVMGQDRPGRVCTYGLVPALSDLRGLTPSRNEAIRMVSDANAEVRDMKERMVAMEQTCAHMAAQMATMMSMMLNMQKLPDEHACSRRDADVSSNTGGLPQLQVHPSSFVQRVPPHQRRAVKRGKARNTSTGKVSSKRN